MARITMTGVALFACLVAFWIYCAISRVLDPGSLLGTLVGDLEGVIVTAFGSAILAGIASAILKNLGYPIIKHAAFPFPESKAVFPFADA